MTRDVETLKRSPYFPSFTECIIPANNDGNTNHNRVTEIINSNNCYFKKGHVLKKVSSFFQKLNQRA